MNACDELSRLLDEARVERLRRTGALVLDVDDTLLAREGASGREETFAESATSALLPELLRCGFRVGLVTGHGWAQLHTRLVAPVVARLHEMGDDAGAACLERLRVYANRGATKIVWDGARHRVEESYAARYQLRAADVTPLGRLLEHLGAEFEADVRARREWYAASFPRFDFETLPARVSEREGAVLVLRPIPAQRHAVAGRSLDPRAQACARGIEMLGDAGLDGEYELAESGRSSIEITRRGISKEAALRDLLAEISAATGAHVSEAEAALVYVGDEFYAGGNDWIIPRVFPRALCFSVAPARDGQETEASVVSLAGAAEGAETSGTAATHALLLHLLNLSA
ncbi:MAG TPA: hypothetical protein VGW12_14960 [Pyrinomonadaceae bacterium]|nr:hypothetical protein [Pyrinomonadaceae bacterium]